MMQKSFETASIELGAVWTLTRHNVNSKFFELSFLVGFLKFKLWTDFLNQSGDGKPRGAN
jgi:hypothetical protein